MHSYEKGGAGQLPGEALTGAIQAEKYGPAMDLALHQAALSAHLGEVPVGAVVINDDGEVISQGRNRREELNDPTAHAEILALRSAGAQLGTSHLEGCTLVVTLEPCAMCAGAMLLARLKRVVFAAWEPKTGACGSQRDLVRDVRATHRLEVLAGLRQRQAQVLLEDFFAQRR